MSIASRRLHLVGIVGLKGAFVAFDREGPRSVERTLRWSSEVVHDCHVVRPVQTDDRIASSLRGFGAGAMPPVCHELAKTGIPVQLIAGGKDYTYVKHMKEMESLNPLFSLEIVDGCGHRVHAGKPKEWLHILRQFIKS